MTNASRPFADSALTYHQRGWAPFPLPEHEKFPPPKGWTGYHAPYPSYADIVSWCENGVASRNIGLRTNPDVIGIDVDDYDDKPGAETFAVSIMRLGALPPSPVLTSRGNAGLSGIRFFRVPPGRAWADVLGPGVEIIHWGHRYAVGAPSIHPSGEQYRWYDTRGAVIAGPNVADLPELPSTWRDELDRGPVEDIDRKSEVSGETAETFTATFMAGQPCGYMTRILSDATQSLGPTTSRHDTVRGLILRIIRSAESGHTGGQIALDTLEAMFYSAFTAGDREVTRGEWPRMVIGAIGMVIENPTPANRRGCCDIMTLTTPAVATDVSEAFWTARDVHQHVRSFAQSRMVSPWAMLGAVLTRVIVATPIMAVLPKQVGTYGTLNLFVALCGPSGAGKGAAEAAAIDAMTFPDPVVPATIGSGEGIAHLYAKRTKQGVERIAQSVLFTVGEIDSFTALGQRQGATLLSELRKAWSGEALGFSYADPHKRLPIPRHSYRMGLIMGVQPGKARELMEDGDGGTPQRFVWLPTTDPSSPDLVPVEPEPWAWLPPIPKIIGQPSHAGKYVMPLPQIATDEIAETRRANLRGRETGLDGHKAYTRTKLAAALALLDGRSEIGEEDWYLSGTVMAVSDDTRSRVASHLAAANMERADVRARAKAHEAVVVSETVESKTTARVSQTVKAVLSDEWQTLGAIKRRVAFRDRDRVNDALIDLAKLGEIVVDRDQRKPLFRLSQK